MAGDNFLRDLKTLSLSIARIVKAIKCPEYCSIYLSTPLSIPQAIITTMQVFIETPISIFKAVAVAIIPKVVMAMAAKNPSTPNEIVIIIIGVNGFRTFISLVIILNPDCLLFIYCHLLYIIFFSVYIF